VRPLSMIELSRTAHPLAGTQRATERKARPCNQPIREAVLRAHDENFFPDWHVEALRCRSSPHNADDTA